MKRRVLILGVITIALVITITFFWPRSIVRNAGNADIIAVMYRADAEDTLQYLDPIQEEVENELLRLLNRSKMTRKLFPTSAIDGIPSGEVTFLITVGEEEKIKYITVGNLNRVTVQGSSVEYGVPNADSILSEMIDVLKFGENLG